MPRLFVISNRVAVPSGQASNAGGLAVALQEALQRFGGVWFGWSGEVIETRPTRPALQEQGPVTYALADLEEADVEGYYNGYANRTLWPLFHYRLDLADFSRETETAYRRVNALFAALAAPLIQDEDLIWVHDYHLIPMAEELRRHGLTQPMGFFLHTPLAAQQVITALPGHGRLMRALCAYDLLGFQTAADLRAFHDYVTLEAGGTVAADGTVQVYGRTLWARVFPIGIAPEQMAAQAAAARDTEMVQRLRESTGERALIIGVDRLDYSKGLRHRFRGYHRFLEKYPGYHRQIEFMQIAPSSRGDVPEYQDIRRTLESTSGRVNGLFGEFDWTPLHYLNHGFPRETLAGFYRRARVGLVTPLRDGMNLVAKEYVAAQNPEDPGVLVLSRFAGAAAELPQAVIINPFDIEDMADALPRALEMPLAERQGRWQAMMAVLHENSLGQWRDRFLDALQAVPRAPQSSGDMS